MVKCSANTKAGAKCKANAINQTDFCRSHQPTNKPAPKPAVKK